MKEKKTYKYLYYLENGMVIMILPLCYTYLIERILQNSTFEKNATHSLKERALAPDTSGKKKCLQCSEFSDTSRRLPRSLSGVSSWVAPGLLIHSPEHVRYCALTKEKSPCEVTEYEVSPW